MIEVSISITKGKRMLRYQRCNPQVVGRDRGTLGPQLTKQGSVMKSRLVIGPQNPNILR